MRVSAFKILLAGHLSLFIFLLVCYIIEPYYFEGSGGMSNYGADLRTFAFFSAGFISAALSSFFAAKVISRIQPSQVGLVRGLYILATMYMVALVSTYPYQINEFLSTVHKFAGLALVVYFVAFSVWLVYKMWLDWVATALGLLSAAGLGIVIWSFLTPAVYLSEGQLLANAAFAGVLLRAIQKLK
jgi:hypothetical protein